MTDSKRDTSLKLVATDGDGCIAGRSSLSLKAKTNQTNLNSSFLNTPRKFRKALSEPRLSSLRGNHLLKVL